MCNEAEQPLHKHIFQSVIHSTPIFLTTEIKHTRYKRCRKYRRRKGSGYQIKKEAFVELADKPINFNDHLCDIPQHKS